MANSADPQTDREWIIQLSEQVKKLGESINDFAETLEKFEEKKMAEIEKRLRRLEEKEDQRLGGWKLILAISVLLGIAVAILKIY